MAFAELVRARTREGVDAHTVIRAIRIAARDALDYVQSLAEESAIDTAATFALTTALLDSVELIIEHISPVDDRESDRHLRAGAERRCISMIADGVAKPEDVARAVEGCELEPTALFHFVRAANTSVAVMQALLPSKRSAGIVTLLDDEVVALLVTLPDRPLSFVAGAGPALPLNAGRQSFELAGRALRTATRVGFSGLCTLEDVGLRAAIIGDPAIGEMLAGRYLDPLHALGEFGDQLLDSVRTYFACGQRVDEAAKALFVHANTLRYRLNRFEETTRCDLHSAETIAEIWWVLTRRGL
jgi:putative transposase